MPFARCAASWLVNLVRMEGESVTRMISANCCSVTTDRLGGNVMPQASHLIDCAGDDAFSAEDQQTVLSWMRHPSGFTMKIDQLDL